MQQHNAMSIISEKLLFITVFFSGASVLMVEIIGTRILAPFFGSTIFVWSSLIITTMGALALAYFFGGKIIDRWPQTKVFYSFILFGGFSLMLVMKASQTVLLFSDKFGIRFGPLFASAALFLIPLFLLGVTSPMVIGLISKNLKTIGSCSGLVFAVGTVGSLFGALISGFFLLPYFSLFSIFLLFGITLLVLAFLGFIISDFSIKKITIYFILFSILITIGIFAFGYKNLDAMSGTKVVYQTNGFHGNIKVVDEGNGRCLLVDGADESCIDKNSGETTASYIQEMGKIIQSRPQNSNILMLGLGAGSLGKYFSETQKVDIVEIDPKIVALSKKYFGFVQKANENIIIDDARHFLRINNNKYDLIAVDVFASFNIPVHLVTREYFELLKGRLNNDGLVVINLVGQLVPFDEYTSSFIQTVKLVFPSVEVTASDEGVANLVIKAGNEKTDTIDQFSDFKIVQVNANASAVFTDDKNSVDILFLSLYENYWKELK
jgi:spermidine synthase